MMYVHIYSVSEQAPHVRNCRTSSNTSFMIRNCTYYRYIYIRAQYWHKCYAKGIEQTTPTESSLIRWTHGQMDGQTKSVKYLQ